MLHLELEERTRGRRAGLGVNEASGADEDQEGKCY
jgi:hypothetical protein